MGTTKSDLAACGFGYNCYDGHDGIDYNTTTDKIYAPADGRVFLIKDQTTAPTAYGNVLYLKHDIDGDKTYDYITLYAHLQDHQFGDDLDEDETKAENVVNAGDFIGNSGGTGGYASHLHFGVRKIINKCHFDSDGEKDPEGCPLVDPYGWWGDNFDPAADREDVTGSYSTSHSVWLWGNNSEQLQVDDQDVSFQHFYNSSVSGAVWREESSTNTNKGRALWTYTTFQPTHEWDNWAVWVAHVHDPSEFEVKVYIPNHTMEGKTITSEANYRVYHIEGHTDVSINQNDNKSKWVSLGTYKFEKHGRAAVRLVEEVYDETEANKVVWADAVKWEGRSCLSSGCRTYRDILVWEWYFKYIFALSCYDVISGYPDGKFRPGNYVNRVEFLKMVVEASLDTCSTDDCPNDPPFIDIDKDAWYYKYIKLAYNRGWIYVEPLDDYNPMMQYYFDPDGYASRGEVAEILVRALGKEDAEYSTKEPFDDVPYSHPDYKFTFIAKHLGIFDGYPEGMACDKSPDPGKNNFCPSWWINRAEVAKVIYLSFFNK